MRPAELQQQVCTLPLLEIRLTTVNLQIPQTPPGSHLSLLLVDYLIKEYLLLSLKLCLLKIWIPSSHPY